MANIGDYRKAKANIRERMNPQHMFNNTSIFTAMAGGAEGKYDEHTVNEIKRKFENWFNSYIKDDLDLISQ